MMPELTISNTGHDEFIKEQYSLTLHGLTWDQVLRVLRFVDAVGVKT